MVHQRKSEDAPCLIHIHEVSPYTATTEKALVVPMRISTEQYIRNPLYVDAVRVTSANFDAIANWCQGEVKQDEVPGKGPGKKYIQVRVHNPRSPRQTKAFVGDWLLYTERGYKVYTNKAFHASFSRVEQEQTVAEAVEAARAAAVSEGIAVEKDIAPGVTQTVQADDGVELVSATPQSIADAVAENVAAQTAVQDAIAAGEQPENVDTVPEQEKVEPAATEGRRVLSVAEQKELTDAEIRELLQSGEAVLAQDIARA